MAYNRLGKLLSVSSTCPDTDAYNRAQAALKGTVLTLPQRNLNTIRDLLRLVGPFNPTHILTKPTRGSNYIFKCPWLPMIG